jgi:hypothetical protein
MGIRGFVKDKEHYKHAGCGLPREIPLQFFNSWNNENTEIHNNKINKRTVCMSKPGRIVWGVIVWSQRSLAQTEGAVRICQNLSDAVQDSAR